MAKIDSDKMWASVIKRYCEAHNMDRSVVECFLDKALEDQGLKLNENFELEKIEEIKGNQGGISPKFKIGDTIRLKGSQVEYTIESISEGFYHCGGCDAGIECADTEFELVEPKHSNVERNGKNCKGKAEKFIKDYTNGCSNELGAVEDRFGKKVISYHEWLTPEQALAAVEIAREEMMEDITIFLEGAHEYTDNKVLQMQYDNEGLIRDFREFVRNKIMKDE